VASAQVKSALLLAALWAAGPTTVEEPAASRDHTERLLAAFGAEVQREGRVVTLSPGRELVGSLIRVPGDISSAAFLLALGLLVGGGGVTVTDVGVNPTRTGFLDVLTAMGGRLTITATSQEAEPMADLTAESSELSGTTIAGDLVPRAIDELPILAVLAAAAAGPTEVRDAAELRVKESDRIRALVAELGKLGVRIDERPDGFRIVGRRTGAGPVFRAARLSSWGDHRLAMALIVAGLVADGPTIIEDIDCVATSYPDFLATCTRLAGEGCVEVTRS
jgi:3-phosphoshikimate 1-carboxyvinyltransferase